MTGPQEHPDLAADLGRRAGEGLAVLATLGEAGVRLAVEEMRRRERAHELAAAQEKNTGRIEAKARVLADEAARISARADRVTVSRAADPAWREQADLAGLARAWRTARVREGQEGFPRATSVAEAVEDRLRQLYLRPMDLYDQAVARGVPRWAAMGAAVAEMAQAPVTRPHGRAHTPALGTGDQPIGVDLLDEAVATERHRLRPDTGMLAFDAELARLTELEPAASLALREILAARAGHERRAAAGADATPDDPRTPAVNEHTGAAPQQERAAGDADRDTAAARQPTAAQIAGQFYPSGLGPAAPRGLAAKREATTRPAPTPRPGTSWPRRNR